MSLLLILLAFTLWAFMVIGMKKRYKKFSRNIRALNIRTLLAISLVLIALDTLTAFLSWKIAPSIFILFEQNELIRYAFMSEHLGSYLVAEANAVIFIVVLFAVSAWTRWVWPRFALLLCPMILAVAVSSNVVGMAVSPDGMAFAGLMILSTFIVAITFLNPRALKWLKSRRHNA